MEKVTKESGQIWKQRYWSNAEMDLMYTKEVVITGWRMVKMEVKDLPWWTHALEDKCIRNIFPS